MHFYIKRLHSLLTQPEHYFNEHLCDIFCWTNLELFYKREPAHNEFNEDSLLLFLVKLSTVLLISVQCSVILIKVVLKIVSEFAGSLCS